MVLHFQKLKDQCLPISKLARDNLVEGWLEDMIISDAEDENNGTYNCFDINEHKGENFTANYVNVDHVNSDSEINLNNLHNNKMNYYRDTHTKSLESNYGKNNNVQQYDNKPNIRKSSPSSIASDEIPYDQDYDMEINQFLDEAEVDCLNKTCNEPLKDKETKCIDNFSNFEREQFEDYYDDFFEDNEDDNIPEWYNKMLQNKIKETKSILEILSTLVLYICTSSTTKNQIQSIERDHYTPFCKLDYPRHPSFSKPWLNYWKFNCVFNCKINPTNANHVHTSKCDIVLEHVKSGITTKSGSISPNEFPSFVMHAVELFQDFINYTPKESYSKKKGFYNSAIWSNIKLRSNYKNELMLVASGKNITPFMKSLTSYFKSGPGRSCNVVSLYCVNENRSQKKYQISPLYLTGCIELRDKIGPITMNYNPKTNMSFNSVQAHLLGKIVFDYLSPNVETTFIDIGSNFGVLGLMLAHKCDKIIGLYTLDHQVKMAEEIKSYNNLHNTSLIVCNPKEVHTKCSSLVKKSITVAALNLASPFGKSFDAIQALRNLPSVWRIVVYGSFKKEFHKYIAILTSKNESLGDEFLPMQGGILDKSPSDLEEYDIVILFERKSLIEPSIELIAAGPTVNIKADIDNSWAFANECKSENKYTLKMEKDFTNKFEILDSPSILQEKDLKPGTSFDCQSSSNFRKIQSDCQSKSKSKDNQLKYMLSLESDMEEVKHTQTIKIKKELNYSSIIKHEDKQLDNLDLLQNQQAHLNPHLLFNKVKIEPLDLEDGEVSPETININTSAPLKSEPINFYSESNSGNVISDNFIKCEAMPMDNNFSDPLSESIVKVEPLSPNKIIKQESDFTSNVWIKTEPSLDSNQFMSMETPQRISEDIENMVTPVCTPAALTFSPLPTTSTNFVTGDGYQITVKPNQSFLSYNKGSMDSCDHSQPSDTTKLLQSSEPKLIKKGKNEEQKLNDTSNCKSNIVSLEVEKKITIKKEFKTMNDKVLKSNDKDYIDADLRMLIEKRKSIKMQLDMECEQRKSKQRNEQSHSPVDKKYKLSHSPSDRKNKFSHGLHLSPNNNSDKRFKSPERTIDRKFTSPLSPDGIKDKRCKSPQSFYKVSDKRYRSPSPPDRSSDRKCRTPLSPNENADRRYTSPLYPDISSITKCRLPLSPDISKGQRCRSPLSPNRRYISPLSPDRGSDKRCRSTLSPDRRYISPLSPDRSSERRCRSPLSPNRRYITPSSPDRSSDRRCRSPPSPDRSSNRRGRSPVSFSRAWDRRYRSPSPPDRISDRRYRSPLSFNRISGGRCRSPLVTDRINERNSRFSLSPVEKRFKRSPQSTYSRSPNLFTEWRYKYRSRSKSPFKTNRVRSPPIRKRKSRSQSPDFL